MRQRIELITKQDVDEFTAIIENLDVDVNLEGYDEHGKPWITNGKSYLANIALMGVVNARKEAFRNVDWNTITCVCEKDIYTLIKKWAIGSELEA